MSHPSDNLLRAYRAPDAVELRSQEDGPDVMVGHFATWNQWTVINSRFEGHFLEQIAPGAFDRSLLARGDKVKVLFDHGHDPSIGNKPLGIPTVIEADSIGQRFEVPLFDASYVNDLKPAIRAGGLGSSFRFSVETESVEKPTRATDWNPDKLPERTLTDVNLYEFGPVTFPAYDTATAGMRSITDEFCGWMRDASFVARMTDRLGLTVVEKILEDMGDTRSENEQEPAEDLAGRAHSQARRQWLATHIYTQRTTK